MGTPENLPFSGWHIDPPPSGRPAIPLHSFAFSLATARQLAAMPHSNTAASPMRRTLLQISTINIHLTRHASFIWPRSPAHVLAKPVFISLISPFAACFSHFYARIFL
jgi:hypothetical protein